MQEKKKTGLIILLRLSPAVFMEVISRSVDILLKVRIVAISMDRGMASTENRGRMKGINLNSSTISMPVLAAILENFNTC